MNDVAENLNLPFGHFSLKLQLICNLASRPLLAGLGSFSLIVVLPRKLRMARPRRVKQPPQLVKSRINHKCSTFINPSNVFLVRQMVGVKM